MVSVHVRCVRVEGEVGRRRGEIPVRSEIGVGQLQPLAEHAFELWYACSNDGTTVNHGTLLANKEPWKQVTIETGITIETQITIATGTICQSQV